jgi:molybdenum cofactor cytidylyltransferase
LIPNTAIVILAAGSSSRLGRPKQLLTYKGKTLICNIVDSAIAAKLSPIIVVTGHSAEEVVEELKEKDVETVFNGNWPEGMGSGIVVGLQKLLELEPNMEDLIIAVCDQPFVTSDFLSNLVSLKNKSKKSIVSSSYAGTFGTPVLFNRKHFKALLGLKGNEGAKKLLGLLTDEMTCLPFEKGKWDIDTEADYTKLIND